MVMNKCFVENNNPVSGPVFSEDSVTREIDLIEKSSSTHEWMSPTGELFIVELPHTVYPPREDTSFMAEGLARLGPGKGRKCLEIGVGSGVLSLFCHRHGWKVSACDINPYAVAAAREFFSRNSASDISVREGGPGPLKDGRLEQWSGGNNFDLVFWNMPYIKTPVEDTQHLGPMEDAALIDTSEPSLITITLAKIKSANLLNSYGVGLFTIGDTYSEEAIHSLCSRYGFASRISNHLNFADGECLRILTFWHPFAKTPHRHREVVASTNSELLSDDWPIGSSLSANYQTKGRGRYNREWINSAELLACSWKINSQKNVKSEALQILCGNIVKQAFEAVKDPNPNCEIILKWPNDLIVIEKENWGKVCGILVESVSKGNDTKIVIGIGINISGEKKTTDSQIPIGFASWYSHGITKDFLFNQIHCRIAGLFESVEGVPESNFDHAKKFALDSITQGFSLCKSLIYRNELVSFDSINSDFTVNLISDNNKVWRCEDSEDLAWLFF